MNRLKVLNSKELKHVFSIIRSQWGSFDSDLVFMIKDDQDLFVSNRDSAELEKSSIKINSFGLYFGELKGDQLRLSIEGSQLVGPQAIKNIVELDEYEVRLWLRGFDLDDAVDEEGYVIIKHKSDFLGCGRVKDGKILNFVPKVRRIKSID